MTNNKKNNKTHVFGLGRAPLSRHTEERHAAFSLPLQYSGFRFPLGAQQTVTFTNWLTLRVDRVTPLPFFLFLSSFKFFLLSLITNKEPGDHYWTAINHFTRSANSLSSIRHVPFDILNWLFRFTRVNNATASRTERTFTRVNVCTYATRDARENADSLTLRSCWTRARDFRFSLASCDPASPTNPFVQHHPPRVVALFIAPVHHIDVNSRTQHSGETMVPLWSRPRVKSHVTDTPEFVLLLSSVRASETIFRINVFARLLYRRHNRARERFREIKKKQKNSRNENNSCERRHSTMLTICAPRSDWTQTRFWRKMGDRHRSPPPYPPPHPPLLPTLIGCSLPCRRTSNNAYLWQYVLRDWSILIFQNMNRLLYFLIKKNSLSDY